MKTKTRQNNKTKRNNMNKRGHVMKSILLFILAVFTALIIMEVKKGLQPVPVRYPMTRSAPKPGPRPSRPNVDQALNRAVQRNNQQKQAFDRKVDQLLDKHEGRLRDAADKAAAEISTYNACCKLIGKMAWDKVRKQQTTQTYLSESIQPLLDPAIDGLARDMDDATREFHRNLNQSTLILAHDLVILYPAHKRPKIDVATMMREPDVGQALNTLGFESIGIGIAITFDIIGLCNSVVVRAVIKQTGKLAARQFSKQVTKAAASITCAVIDGPVPVGDVIAALGIAWTAYDIHTSRKAFQRDMKNALDNVLGDARVSIREKAEDQATDMHEQYLCLQQKMSRQAANSMY